MKICSVTTIKASLSDTLDFVYYHLNIGIDHMFLFFDDPNDIAIEELSTEDRVTCIRCTKEYWNNHPWWGVVTERINGEPFALRQKIFLARKLVINASFLIRKLEEALEFDWLAWIDADELLYLPDTNIHTLLENVPEDFKALHTTMYEAVPEQIEYDAIFKHLKLFKTTPYPDDEMIRKFFIRHHATETHRWPFVPLFHGGTAGHHIIRVKGRRVRAFDPHDFHYFPEVLAPPEDRFESDQIKVLHFDGRSFSQWKEKWKGKSKDRIHKQIGYGGYAPDLLHEIREFLTYYPQDEYLKRLFEKKYFLPPSYKEVLLELDLLREVELDPSLFRR